MGISSYSTNPASNTTISGINIAEGCAPSGINDAIRQLMADIAAGVSPQQLPTATGTANAVVVALTPAVTLYAGGQRFQFLPAANSTGAVTINYGGGVINLQKRGGLALALNDLLTGVVADVEYDGTRATLLNPQQYSHGADVASAATVVLDTVTGDYVYITGTTGITAITLAEGREVTTKFAGAVVITNGASLIAPGGANFTTAVGDIIIWRGEASGVVRAVGGIKANGQAFGSTTVPLSSLAAAAGLSALAYASAGSAAPVAVALTAAQLLGANAGGTAVAGITLGTGLSMSSTTLNATAGVVTVKKQTFSGSGTYTPSTGMLFCIAEVLGGGAGGGANGASGGAPGGGGAGAYAKALFTAATIGASKAVTIGALGAGGTGSGNGSAGGTSSLGALISCPGGSGGIGTGSFSVGANAGGAGGTAPSGGDINIPGGNGHWGVNITGNAAGAISGRGADSIYGSGGASMINTGGTGSAGGGFGAGGGGAGNNGNTGGAGTAGVVYITEFCSQ